MSLDILEMGGMSNGRTGTDGGKKPIKNRKMKEDVYDKDDGFVDEELLWTFVCRHSTRETIG
jgi:hypothetical protein